MRPPGIVKAGPVTDDLAGVLQGFEPMPMGALLLEGSDQSLDLTLAVLNEATQVWAELGYNQKIHSETGQTPLARWLAGPDITRPCPDSAALRLTFTKPIGAPSATPRNQRSSLLNIKPLDRTRSRNVV